MKILIKQCNDKSRWYSKFVGQTFPLLQQFDNEYLTLQTPCEEFSGYKFKNYILKEDGELINE